VAWGTVLVLLIPVVIINLLKSMILRLVLIIISTAVVIAILAVLSKARILEMFIAGAT
jgi:VIT1/CCC1 family predicted Fe2+/Mn2+ transporter